jgi:hypothetical protein
VVRVFRGSTLRLRIAALNPPTPLHVFVQSRNRFGRDSAAPDGAGFGSRTFPTADAVDYIPSPLRGSAGQAARQDGQVGRSTLPDLTSEKRVLRFGGRSSGKGGRTRSSVTTTILNPRNP